jgi:hypothetical protein
MSSNRREFLRTGAFAALGLSLPFAGRSSMLEEYAKFKTISTFGIQLWTVKEDMASECKSNPAEDLDLWLSPH